MPFLDSVGEQDEHGPDRGALIRPWMSYWPPEADSELHALLQKSVPEVLTWRFDPKNPFNRPWQSWTKSAVLGGKVCTSRVLKPNSADKADDRQETNQNNEKPRKDQSQQVLDNASFKLSVSVSGKDANVDRVMGTKQIDSEIAALRLSAVVPTQLNYLSEDSLYRTTKPFHTRLPFMGKIRRSNVVAQGYSNVNIHDICGHEDKFTLEKSGFQYVHAPVDIADWTNESAHDEYLPAMELWLKDFFKVEKVHIFTYTVS